MLTHPLQVCLRDSLRLDPQKICCAPLLDRPWKPNLVPAIRAHPNTYYLIH
ncbi:hypothetical protein Mal33_23160 [Rosistilla oblonga]|uniref:Uncharacterized protein n=1 Tax=Rosistilla oblonga TaxID=2527990 RepID=A0A518ITB4_9BACT|nr:hypothetical protein Mal33_23160 [Rosistilla oblonga]